MSGPARGRRKLVLGAGLLTALILVMAALRSRDLLVWYHVQVLRGDPGLMPAWLAAPAESLQGQALRRFLHTPAGVLRLRQRIIDEVIGLGAKDDPAFLLLDLATGRFLQFGLFDIGKDRYLFIEGPRTIFKSLGAESEILAWGPLLEVARDRGLRAPGAPGGPLHDLDLPGGLRPRAPRGGRQPDAAVGVSREAGGAGGASRC